MTDLNHLNIEKINEQRIEAYKEVERLEQQLKAMTKKYNALQKRFEAQVDTIIRTRTTRDEYKSRLHRAESSLVKLKDRLSNATAEIGGLRFQLNSTKEQLKHAQRELAQ